MSRNPFNATQPAEWATMSKKLRKAWNRKHWRPEQWKCDLALKKEATRMKHRGERSGKGVLTLAERLAKTNPSHDLGEMIDRDPTVRELLKYDGLASAYKRASSSDRMRILEKLSDVSERARTIRRTNPKRDGSPTRGERKARSGRERRKYTTLSARERARIEREETASGYSINPRRRRRHR